MKNLKYKLYPLIILCVISVNASAHKRWIMPSLFTVSENQWIAVDATVSNNLFYPDRPWPLQNLNVTAPNLAKGTVENQATGHRRSTFDVNLDQTGTFKISLGGSVYFASYPKQDPKSDENPNHTIRDFSYETLKNKIPKGIEAKFAESISRLESYVTVGAPSMNVFKPTNSGIEFVPVTHPNDLYQGEKATFAFLIDGKKVKDIKVLLVQEGTRYRSEEQELILKTDKNGEVAFSLNKTGKFLIEISHEVDLPKGQKFSKKYMSYFGTFEVLPQ